MVCGAGSSLTLKSTSMPHRKMSNWKNEYIKLISSTTISHEDIERAQQLKNHYLPKRIFKYRHVNDKSIKNLKNDTIWLSAPHEFNDPYDCRLTFDNTRLFQELIFERIDQFLDKNLLEQAEADAIECSTEPIRDLLAKTLRKTKLGTEDQYERLIEGILQLVDEQGESNIEMLTTANRDNVKVCSFSERNDSLAMWAHYSNNHQGFCIEYMTNDWPPDDIRRRMLFPVIYSDELFDATSFIIESMRNQRYNNIFGIVAATHKSVDWSYEKEWRLVSPIEQPSEFTLPQPSAIYLGTKMTKDDEDRICRIAEAKSIPVFKMTISSREFKMQPRSRK